jgi:uncharacterized protein (DUF934 family)
MATLIKHGRIENDSWRLLSADIEVRLLEVSAHPDLIVPLVLWQRRREALLARGGRLGLRLAPDEGPEAVAQDLACFALIALEFPEFTDGRGYSTARLLRERHGFEGELRAIGDVQRDQLLNLQRCGFDSFALRDDQDPVAALDAFKEFAVRYQGDALDPRPLFRRRLAPWSL